MRNNQLFIPVLLTGFLVFSITSCDFFRELFPDQTKERGTVLDSIYGTTDSLFGCQIGLVIGCSMESYTSEKVSLDTFEQFPFLFPYIEGMVQNSIVLGTATGKLNGKTYFAEYDTTIPLPNTSDYNAHRGSFEIRFDDAGNTIEELEIISTTKYTTNDGSVHYDYRIVMEGIPFSNADGGKAWFKIEGATLAGYIPYFTYKENYWTADKRVMQHYWGNSESTLQVIFNKP